MIAFIKKFFFFFFFFFFPPPICDTLCRILLNALCVIEPHVCYSICVAHYYNQNHLFMRDFTRLLIALCTCFLLAILPKTTFAQNPIIKLSFDEANGATPLNTGTASATFVRSNLTPVTSTNVPSQDGNVSALDFGVTPANYYVESSTIIPALQNLTTFTITGWVNAKSNIAGSGGNRIVCG